MEQPSQLNPQTTMLLLQNDTDVDENVVWVASMLDAHSELSELSAFAVDSFIYMSATHEDTLHFIERCY